MAGRLPPEFWLDVMKDADDLKLQKGFLDVPLSRRVELVLMAYQIGELSDQNAIMMGQEADGDDEEKEPWQE